MGFNFNNGFESMIGKLPFLDLDSSRNSEIMFLVEPEELEMIPVELQWFHAMQIRPTKVG